MDVLATWHTWTFDCYWLIQMVVFKHIVQRFYTENTKLPHAAVTLFRLGSLSKMTPVAILTSVINLTLISCFCTCSVSGYTQELTIIWQISCWKQMVYCTQNGLNHEQKAYLPMFLTRIQSQSIVFVVRIDVWMQLHVLFSHTCSLLHRIFHTNFHNFPWIFCFQLSI